MTRAFKAIIAAVILMFRFAAPVLAFLCLFIETSPTAAKDLLLDHLNSELTPLSRMERLVVLKIAENKITEQLREIATDPAIKTEGPIWLMKVASFSYGALTLLLERPFPNVSAIYRDRTELYSEVVRGKLRISEMVSREQENDTVKQRVLDQELSALTKIERPPTDSRVKTLVELGSRLGLMIAAHGKMSAGDEERRRAIAAAPIVQSAAPPAAGPLEDAIAAYDRSDYLTALRLFRPLADQGVAVAQYHLGVMHKYGWGAKEDYKEAFKWMSLAADKGSALAQYGLGEMYERGTGIAQNYTEALKWYRLAANQRTAIVQNNPGGMQDKGSAWAQYRLGLFSELGMNGVTKDHAEAMKWYRLAADQGHSEAQYMLGEQYLNGGIVKQSYTEALKWYRLAVNQGHSLSKIALGDIYMRGAGVPQNFILAYMWFDLYAASEPAYRAALVKDRLANISQHMAPSQIAEAQKLAREWKPTTQPPR